MGNLFGSALKIITLAAKAIIISLTASAQPATPAKPIAAKPVAPYIQYTQPTAGQKFRCFETNEGSFCIFTDSHGIMP